MTVQLRQSHMDLSNIPDRNLHMLIKDIQEERYKRIILRFNEGMKQADIAHLFGIGIATVARAIKKYRQS